MANITLVTCPSCQHELNIVHGLQVFETMPKTVTDDDSLITGVGICERTGQFIWRTTDGWHRQEEGTEGVFLGNDDSDEDTNDA